MGATEGVCHASPGEALSRRVPSARRPPEIDPPLTAELPPGPRTPARPPQVVVGLREDEAFDPRGREAVDAGQVALGLALLLSAPLGLLVPWLAR